MASKAIDIERCLKRLSSLLQNQLDCFVHITLQLPTGQQKREIHHAHD